MSCGEGSCEGGLAGLTWTKKSGSGLAGEPLKQLGLNGASDQIAD
jgi:hypothetical protein